MDISEPIKLALTGLLALLFGLPFHGLAYMTRRQKDSEWAGFWVTVAFVSTAAFVVLELLAGIRFIWG